MPLQPYSQHARGQQVPAYNRSFVSIIQSYDCKQVPVGLLHAEKVTEVVLLNVFRIGFPASLLLHYFNTKKANVFNVIIAPPAFPAPTPCPTH